MISDFSVAHFLRRIAQWLLLVVSMLGAFSLARLSVRFDTLGLLGEPRFLIAMLLCVIASLAWGARAVPLQRSATVWVWLTLFVAGHAFLAASRLWSDDPWMAEQQLSDLLVLGLSFAAFAWAFANEPQFAIHGLLVTSVAIGLPLAAAGMIVDDLASVGVGGIGFARLCGVACLALLYYSYRNSSSAALWFVPLLLVGMMRSGSRAAILALAVAMAYLWWQRRRLHSGVRTVRRGNRVLPWTLGIGASVAFFATPVGGEILQAFIASNFVAVSSTGQTSDGVYLADRDIIFNHALRAFLQQPLTGLGIGSYRGPFGEEYPHNILLMYAVDGGLIPLALLLFSIGVFLHHALCVRAPWAVAATAVGVFSLSAAMFAGSYYDARLFWFVTSMLVWAGRERLSAPAETVLLRLDQRDAGVTSP